MAPQDYNQSLQSNGMLFLAPGGPEHREKTSTGVRRRRRPRGHAMLVEGTGFLQGEFLPVLAMVPIRVMLVDTREYVPTNVSTARTRSWSFRS